jgi:cell wall-associated NlpC family hydrolase
VTDRATGRHRAPARATTPLSTLGISLSSTVTEHVTGIGRSGVILAMSSGLVATMGLPAGAQTRDAPNTAALRRAAQAVDSGPADPSLAGVPSSFVSGEAFTAPPTAALTFDRSSFTAVPRPEAPPAPAASRSMTRTGLRSAGTSGSSRTLKTPATDGSLGRARGSSVIAVAARYLGVPYRYGGTTPQGFDCSGYAQYVFAQFGIKIPRTADQQYDAATRISSSQARPGDLVFFLGSGGAYHVGIYAGAGMMYDAGKPGQAIGKRDIWSAVIAFGRF